MEEFVCKVFAFYCLRTKPTKARLRSMFGADSNDADPVVEPAVRVSLGTCPSSASKLVCCFL